ncbi:MAG: autotransporter domain-containing protein [Gammaproteobacteria bacterium]
MAPIPNKNSRILTQAALASTLIIASSGVWADVTVNLPNAPVAPPVDMANLGGPGVPDNLKIATTGNLQDAGANNGVNANTAGKSISIDANNIFGDNAIQTNTGHGIEVTANAVPITIGAGSGMTVTGGGASNINILVGGTNTTINNSGKMTTNNTSAIKVAGANANITNTATGELTAALPAANVVNFLSNFVTFDNAGKITSVGTGGVGSAIFWGPVAGNINNTGTISGNENDAINIQGMTGTLTNTGTITSSEDAIAVNVANATGSIVNNAGGVIETLGTINNFTPDGAIRLSTNLNAITNTGTIRATSNGTGSLAVAIGVDAAVTMAGNITNNAGGTIQGIKGNLAADDGAYAIGIIDNLKANIINNGLITTDFNTAVGFAATLASKGILTGNFTNTGTISVTDAASPHEAIGVDDAANKITGTLNNAGGIIKVAKVNGNAIDFSDSTEAFKLTNSGTITGNVLLSQGANTFNMTAGTLTGALTSSAAGVAANTFTITGGTITGIVTLSPNDGEVINIQNATLQSALVGDIAKIQTLNVTGDFNSSAAIQNIKTIQVKNAGTDFVVGGDITGVNTTFSTAANTTTTLNANLSGAGDVMNAGTLTVNAGKTMTMTGAGLIDNTGSINNAGTITQNTIDIQAGAGNITNSGLIDGINKEAIKLSADFTGDITNTATGTITTKGTNGPGESAIRLDAFTLTGAINNAGTINVTDATGGAAIKSGDSAVTKGITNTGTLSTKSADAVDLSASTKSLAFTNSGTVTGNVKLSQALNPNDTTFTMTGGTITGNVTVGGTNASTLALNGGTLAGNLTLSNQADIINLKTATITGNIVGDVGAAQTLNVLDDFTSSGTIANVKTITVQNAGTSFEVGGAITGLDTQLTVNAGTLFDANANVTGAGAVTNEGTFFVSAGKTLQMTGGGGFTNTAVAGGGIVGIEPGALLKVHTYTQNVGNNTLGFQISDAANYGKLQTTVGAFDLTGSKLAAQLSGTGLVANGDVYTIITSAAGGGVNGATFIQPNSQTVSFTPSILGNDLILTATRKTLASISSSGDTAAVAGALDQLFPGQGVFRDLFLQFDQLGSQQAIDDALQTLLPATGGEINEGLADILDHHQAFTMRHLDHLSRPNRMPTTPQIPTIGGINSGDMVQGEKGLWGYVFYAMGEEKNDGRHFGYDVDNTGIGIGWDGRIWNDTILGASFGYSQADYESNNRFGDTQRQSGYMISLYGEHDITGRPMYVDGMASITWNHYKTRRQIAVNDAQGQNLSKFEALYYDLYTRINYDHPWKGYTLTPFVSLEYAHFSPDEYTETGYVPMVVRPQSTNVLEPGLGLKIWWENHLNDARYLPELYISFQYDLLNEGLKTNSAFAGTATQSFLIDSAKSAPFSYNLGFNLTAYNQENWQFVLGYDFEGRSGFRGHTANMKLRYTWD